jgi:hypothetical protein
MKKFVKMILVTFGVKGIAKILQNEMWWMN